MIDMKVNLKFKILFILSFLLTLTNIYSGEIKNEVGIDERLGEKIPLSLKFYNSDGDTLTLGKIIDKPVVLSLVYYHCPGICTPLLTNLSETLDQIKLVPGQDFKVITISFDPYETPDKAAKWKKSYIEGMKRKDMNPNFWYFMTGDSLSISKLTDAIGFHFKSDGKKDFIHAGAIYILAKDGKISRYMFGTEFLPQDLKLALIEAQREEANPTINKILAMCYSYDPVGRQFKLSITRVIGSFMLIGAVVFLAVLVVKKKVNKNNENKDSIGDNH
jgi:protein SCO1